MSAELKHAIARGRVAEMLRQASHLLLNDDRPSWDRAFSLISEAEGLKYLITPKEEPKR